MLEAGFFMVFSPCCGLHQRSRCAPLGRRIREAGKPFTARLPAANRKGLCAASRNGSVDFGGFRVARGGLRSRFVQAAAMLPAEEKLGKSPSALRSCYVRISC